MQYAYNTCDWLLLSEELIAGVFLLAEIVTKKFLGDLNFFYCKNQRLKLGRMPKAPVSFYSYSEWKFTGDFLFSSEKTGLK